MNTLLDEINRWWPVLGVFATAFYGWGLYHLSARFATKGDVETMIEEQEAIVSRLDDLERRMETVPDSETMHKIALSLAELRGDMRGLSGRMDGMETSLAGLKNEIGMLIEHHLEGAR